MPPDAPTTDPCCRHTLDAHEPGPDGRLVCQVMICGCRSKQPCHDACCAEPPLIDLGPLACLTDPRAAGYDSTAARAYRERESSC